MSEKKSLNRRDFFKNSAAVTLGAGFAAGGITLGAQEPPAKPAAPAAPAAPVVKVKEYRTLGRTGFKVSDISSGFVNEEALLNQILDAGVNYIDTAESYKNQTVVGNVIKNRDRSKLFITSKLEIQDDKTKEGFIKRFEQCLAELQTGYIDCMMMHSVENLETIKTPGFHEAMAEMKKQKKLRFVGISNHGTNFFLDASTTMKDVLIAAANDGRFDVMLLAYNFIQDDGGEEVLKICREKNIGATLMKVNPLGNLPMLKTRLEQMQKEGKKIPEQYPPFIAKLEAKQAKAQAFIELHKLDNPVRMRAAAIRFVLNNKDTHSVCCSFRNFDDLESYISLSGTTLSDMEKVQLSLYREGCGDLYCRHACGKCEPSCPMGVRVNSVMRFRHYYEVQQKEKYAMAHYAHLSQKADVCADCNGYCEKACPYGVPVQGLLNIAHKTLTLA